MPISDIANIQISVSGAGPTLAGFGEPMCLAYHTEYTDRSREYSSLSGVGADFPTTAPAYLMAQAVFSQIPSPPALKVGRRALPYTQVLHVTCLSTSATDTYVFTLKTPGGVAHQLSIASTGVPATDVATINTAVTALSIPNLTATHTTSPNVLILTMASGFLLDILPDVVHCSLQDVTADPGIATDINAVIAADPNWYGLLTDSQSQLEVEAAAANIEAEGGAGYLYIYNNSDTICATSSTSDVMSTLQTSAYNRTAGLFAQTQLLCYSAAGWMGRMFPTVAGSENWAFKTIAGVPADALTTAQVHAVEGKNGSVYTNLAGLNLTQFGKCPSGEWIDIIRGRDALTNVMQIGILALQANSLKVPYTDAGIDMYRSVIAGTLKQFIDTGFIADTPAPYISLPAAASVSSTSKAARNLPNVSFTATLAGAINTTTINGVLSV
jgi:hypothetical protein